MKKILALVLALTMLVSVAVAASAEIKIGVSIWSSTDTLGSECKRIIDRTSPSRSPSPPTIWPWLTATA